MSVYGQIMGERVYARPLLNLALGSHPEELPGYLDTFWNARGEIVIFAERGSAMHLGALDEWRYERMPGYINSHDDAWDLCYRHYRYEMPLAEFLFERWLEFGPYEPMKALIQVFTDLSAGKITRETVRAREMGDEMSGQFVSLMELAKREPKRKAS